MLKNRPTTLLQDTDGLLFVDESQDPAREFRKVFVYAPAAAGPAIAAMLKVKKKSLFFLVLRLIERRRRGVCYFVFF